MRIRPFEARDQAPVRALILRGLEEHWGSVDPDLNPDLDDIGSAYAGGQVLVGTVAGRIVATGTVRPLSSTHGEVVRMSVAPSCRRQGVGRSLLEALERVAAEHLGLERLVVETTATWRDVVSFYVACGYAPTHVADGPFGPEQFLEKRLTAP